MRRVEEPGPNLDVRSGPIDLKAEAKGCSSKPRAYPPIVLIASAVLTLSKEAGPILYLSKSVLVNNKE